MGGGKRHRIVTKGWEIVICVVGLVVAPGTSRRVNPLCAGSSCPLQSPWAPGTPLSWSWVRRLG